MRRQMRESSVQHNPASPSSAHANVPITSSHPLPFVSWCHRHRHIYIFAAELREECPGLGKWCHYIHTSNIYYKLCSLIVLPNGPCVF